MHHEFTAVYERDGDWVIAFCPEVPGANGQGRSKAEARESLAAAIALVLEDRRDDCLRGVPDRVWPAPLSHVAREEPRGADNGQYLDALRLTLVHDAEGRPNQFTQVRLSSFRDDAVSSSPFSTASFNNSFATELTACASDADASG